MFVIHIGLKKSGSASIQTFLAANEDALRSVGVDYSPVGRTKRKAHHNLASEAIVRKRFSAERGTLADLAEAAQKSQAKRIIISSEVFEGCEDHAVEYIKAALAPVGRDFCIVLIVRELMDLITSSFAQKIRYGFHTYDFDEFFESRLNETRVDYFETASRWANSFGWESIRIRPLDARHLRNGDLIDDFLECAGVDINDPLFPPMVRPGLVNAASGWKTLEAIRGLHLGRHGLSPTHPLAILVSNRKVRAEGKAIERVAQDISKQLGWSADKSLYLTRAQAQQSLDIYVSAIEALNERLTIPLPPPRTLDERGFTERAFLPDISRISPVELEVFFDEIADSLFAEARGKPRAGADERIVEQVVGSKPAIMIRYPAAQKATPTLLIESNQFYDLSDRSTIASQIREITGGEAVDVQFVPTHFLRLKPSGQISRPATEKLWAGIVAARSRRRPNFGKTGRLKIVSLAFGRTLRQVRLEHLTNLAEYIGGPVQFKSINLPPAPILVSDAVFLEYSMTTIKEQRPFEEMLKCFDELRSADALIIDDISELQWPMRRCYPILSHQLQRSEDADLLAYRQNPYIVSHHQLPVAVINGQNIGISSRDTAIDALSRLLGVPIFRIATTQALTEHTSEWDHRPMSELVGTPGIKGIDPDELVRVLGEWINQKVVEGAVRSVAGQPTAKFARQSDQLAFECQAVDRAALTNLLTSFDRFRVVGPGSSLSFIEKFLHTSGKTYVRADTHEAGSSDTNEPFDCLISCGANGYVDTPAAAVALMPAGWPTPAINAPSWMAGTEWSAVLPGCQPEHWYSPTASQNRYTVEERALVAEITRLIRGQRLRRLSQSDG